MDWRQAIEQWRALSPEEKALRRWNQIPYNVAASMEFEGEPVELQMLLEEHARRPLPRELQGRGPSLPPILAGKKV